MADGSSPTSKVKFIEGEREKHSSGKPVTTQKYDKEYRKEIQKRLDLETWMEEQLEQLYESEDYPQLDVDDVHKIPPEEREEKLKDYLSEAKRPADEFIKELITKAADIKPVDSS